MRSDDRPGARGLLARCVVLAATLLVAAGGFVPVATGHAAAAPAQGCGYVLGFASLRDKILKTEGSDPVGSCREAEYHALSGDGIQWTNGGLFVWRKATNWTGFTDGTDTWVAGPNGVAKRSDSERFPWENTGRPEAVSYLASPGAALPAKVETDEAIRELYVLQAASGGATFNLYFGDLGGTKLYAVSLYPDRSVVVPGKQPTLEALRKFVSDNGDLLSDPRVSAGTWFNSDDGMTYLDVSATVPDKQEAIDLGKRYNQISIFDLGDFQDIDTGGTGKTIPNLPPDDDRLPRWSASGN